MIFINSFFIQFNSIIIFLIIFSCIAFISFINFQSSNNSEFQSENISSEYFFSTSDFFWPTPGFQQITSSFGKRNAPTAGSSSNHSGIDIAAPEGTYIYSVLSGKVSFVGFKGAGGCTVIIDSGSFSISYCHVSSNYLVNIGDIIYAGNIIANVGPKNIYNIPNNPYKDKNGNPTNGATTGCHLHLTIKKDGIAVNPLNFF